VSCRRTSKDTPVQDIYLNKRDTPVQYNVPEASDFLQRRGTQMVVQFHQDEETVTVAPSELRHSSQTS